MGWRQSRLRDGTHRLRTTFWGCRSRLTPMFAEEEFLPLSGLQHIAFCQRRWALVHLEGLWQENRFTVEGKILHEKAHSGEVGSKPGVLIRRTLPIHSYRLGIVGQTDVVEFQPLRGETGVSLEGRDGRWRPYPIEYKRSRDRSGSIAYRVQLCAQGLCLEEMFRTCVPEGAVYDSAARRRQPIVFDAALREEVTALAFRMHELHHACLTPKARYERKCESCSLRPLCLPKVMEGASADRYIRRGVSGALAESGGARAR